MSENCAISYTIIRRGDYFYLRFQNLKNHQILLEKSTRVIASQIGEVFDGRYGGKAKYRQCEEIARKYIEQYLSSAVTPRVLEYCRDYWDYDGERVMLANKKNPDSVARSSCYTNLMNFNNHLAKYFKDNPNIGDITSKMLNDIQDDLLMNGGLENSTVEKVMRSVTTPLNDAYKHEILDRPVRIDRIDTRGKEKGILTMEQLSEIVRQLFLMSREGRHTGANEGIALASLTAMRMGEVRALRAEQIEVVDDTSIIHITRTWSDHGGDKIPKGKRTRQVTVPTVIAKACLELAEQNPYGNGRVFWSDIKDTVKSASFFRNNLYEAMRRAGISDAERESKNLTFHSLRHGYVSYIRHQVSDGTMRLAIGHRDKETTDRYTHQNLDNLRELADSTDRTFRDVIQAESEIKKNL